MVRGKISQGNEKVGNLSSSDSRELENDDETSLPRGGPNKNNGLSSSKPDDEQKIFPTLQQFVQTIDEQHQQQIQPKRGRGRPRKIPITATITNNDIDQNSSISNNSESSSSKIILNHQEFNDLDDNLINSNEDEQHNIISVIEIVDESQDDSITNIINIDSNDNLEYSNESHINLAQNDYVNNQLQNETNSIIIEEVINKPASVNFNDDDDDDDLQSEIENIRNEPESFEIQAKMNTESIITISSDESNFKTEVKSRDTPTSEFIIGRGIGGAGDIVQSPDILQVRINPNSARTYQNKRKSKIDNDININLDNLSNNNSKFDKNILEINQFKDITILDVEDNLQIQNDSTINSIECRRSSRKKTMKYDVRDLLNKNRKKIQIEARIDSLPKKLNENATIISDDEIKLMPDNNCKISPIAATQKLNELHGIVNRKSESPQLSPIQLNDRKISLPQSNSATNLNKNLIQIQSRKSFENSTNQLPPPPPLKSIAELDRKNLTIPNGLYPNELNKNNIIYTFHDAFNSGIIKSVDNEYHIQPKNVNTIQIPPIIKNISSTIVSSEQTASTTTTIPPPVLSSMVKSPLLNIKFKHQNLAIRKSFDNLINVNSVTNCISDSDNTVKEIQPLLNIDDQRNKNNAFIIDNIEKPIKVKGKRGRPPKNKLLSPKILDNSSALIQQENNKCEILQNLEEKSIKQFENPITQKNKLIQSPENLVKLSIDNKIKGKQNYQISTITNNAGISPINSHYSNVIANFTFMETKVKIKRLSNRSSTESIDINTNNKYNHFTDYKNNDVIEKSNENKNKHEIIESDKNRVEKMSEKRNNINKDLDIRTKVMSEAPEMDMQVKSIPEATGIEVQTQIVEKPITLNVTESIDEIINPPESQLQTKKNENELKEEISSPINKNRFSEFENIEKLEKNHTKLEDLFKTHSTNKKNPKVILNKDSIKFSSFNDPLQELPKHLKERKDYKKKLEEKYGKSLLSKIKEKCDGNERKNILPQNKLFLENEKIHELKLQKLERKKPLQNKEKEHNEKSALKNLKKLSTLEKSCDQSKNLVEDMEKFFKPHEEFNISEELHKSVKEIVNCFENQIVANKSEPESENKTLICESIVQKMKNKDALEIHKTDEPHTDLKSQKDIQTFETLAEKLIDNEINSLNCNENITNQKTEHNDLNLLNRCEVKVMPILSIQKNIEILEGNKIENNDKSMTLEIIENSDNIIQDEENQNDNVITSNNCLGIDLSNIEMNEILITTKNNSGAGEMNDQKEEIISEDKPNTISTMVEVSKDESNDSKVLVGNSSTAIISTSATTESNDPLKDIEKFLEAAGNLLSRSLSSEDNKEPPRRRVRTGTRFKDNTTKDDDYNEHNISLSDDDALPQFDTESSDITASLQIIKDESNIPISTKEELKLKHDLNINISKIDKEELKEVGKDLTKTENLEKSLVPEFPLNQDSVIGYADPDYQNVSINIQSENSESNPSEFLPNTLTEFPTISNENLNFSHKFPSEESTTNSPLSIEKRAPGPRTPPFPPPKDMPIDEEKSFLQNSLKSEELLLNIESNSNTTTDTIDFHSDSMTSNSNSSKSTELKNIKTKVTKKLENDLKLIKKLKRKDEKKLKKKDGITDELKRTIKEMKKIKKSTSDGNFMHGTLSKAAMKSYSPVNSIDNGKTDGDSRSLDDLLDLDENQIIYDENNKNIRRSHRLKTITKSQSVGRGLVRDRERYDKEYDDIKPDLAVIEAQNAKFLKDMEERLSQFQVIRDNEYKCERVISKEAKKMICDCFLTREEEERGEFGCGEDCLNRLLMIECGPKCIVGDRCTNRRFQRAYYAPCKVFQTEKKGCGIMADAEIPCGQFIMEYVGEVLNSNQFEKRAEMYSQDKNKHYYFMALRSDAIIDATTRGNISRFINHSCDPNAETQKWTVNGELRIGFFTTRTILSGEEITFDYQFQRYGKEAQRCYCETSNCRGWIGEEPEDSDEEELEDESEDDDKVKTESKKEISHKIHKEIPNDPKPKSVQDISEKTDTDIDKENIEIIKRKPDKKEKQKRGRKKRLDFRLGKKNYEFIDDPDLEDEVLRLLESGLKNQLQTLCLSRLFVRAKQLETRLNLLEILRKGEMSCRRLFLDYHGLKLLHGWMSETTELVKDTENDLKIRLNLLETLECLPIPNKTMLKDSKVFQTVQNWSLDKTSTESSPNDGSPNENSNSGLTTPITTKSSTDFLSIDSEKPILLNTNENLSIENPLKVEIKRISTKLIIIWDGLPEVFRIPRKERVEQMKEHEREADKQYAALKLVDDEIEIRRNRGRFTKDIKDSSIISNNTDLTPGSGCSIGKYKWSRDIKSEIIKERRKEFEKSSHQDGLSKLQRRQIFAAKVAQHEAEKRLADEKREFDIKCKFYGLDPLTTYPRDFPFCVNPATGQWYTIDRRKIPTPPSHAHIKVPPKPQSTKPEDYQLPSLDLPPFWKFAIDPHKGRIYYYHMKIRIPQWEPPIKILPLNDGSSTVTGTDISIPGTSRDIQNDENDSSDSGSESGDSVNDKSKDDSTADGKLAQALNPEQKKLERKKKRYALLVQEKPISPRREEDRVYNQLEMRRYKENKEKIRRRKEEIKRRKIQLARQLTDQQNNPDLETNNDNNEDSIALEPSIDSDSCVSPISGGIEALPIADYLLSSDEEETITTFCDANLIEKIVKGEKIVDELDALNINRPLKRLLSFKEKSNTINNSLSLSSVEHKSKKSKTDEKKLKNDDEIKKPKSSSKLNNPKYLARKAKEKFRADIAGIIVSHLTPYRKETCKTGKITKNEDFKHLARKLTHFVMVKELKHCDLTGQQLIVTDSVKNKSREFIKKYMAKYGEIYIRPENDPEFKEIPH